MRVRGKQPSPRTGSEGPWLRLGPCLCQTLRKHAGEPGCFATHPWQPLSFRVTATSAYALSPKLPKSR